MPKDELKEAMRNVDGGTVTDDDKQVIVDTAAEIETEKNLEKSVQEKLDGLGLDSDGDKEKDDTDTEDGTEKDTEDNTDDTDDGTDKSKDDEDNKNTDKATSEDEKKTDDEPLTLPAQLMQTAVRLGMSEKEVKDNFDKNPEFMIAALGELHKGENGLSARYSQVGRAIREKEIAAQKNTSDDETPPESFVDIKKLKAQYEDSDEEMLLIDKVIKPLNDALGKLSKQVSSQVQPNSQPAYNQQEDRAIHSEINSFFDNDNLKQFRDYYGTVKPGEDPRVVLTGAQVKHRLDTCNEGNLIRMGADFAGETLAISDVLNRAHLQLTESMRAEMIRESLSAKIKKRGKGISIKAGTKQGTKKSSEETPEKQLESDTAKRLKAIKW